MSYRQIFDEAIGESPPSTIDLDRIVARRRRGAWIWPLVAAAAVLLVAGGLVVALGATREPATTPPVSAPADYFPEYAQGARIIAEASAPLTDGEVTVTFTPSVPQQELTFFVRCDPAGTAAAFDMEVGMRPGTWFLGDFCGERSIRPSPGWPEFARTGEPATITLTITGGRSVDSAPPDGTFGLAVGEPVPFAEYPLPSPPAVVPPLAEVEVDPDFDYRARRELRADPADPGRPQELVLDWPGTVLVLARAQTPGHLRVQVDGVEIGQLTAWDYQQHELALDLGVPHAWEAAGVPLPEPGQQVTLTVVPEHVTGDWTAAILLAPTPD